MKRRSTSQMKPRKRDIAELVIFAILAALVLILR